MNSKELLRNVLDGKEAAISPFIPLASCFAARVAQIPLEQMFLDPTKLANALHRAQRLGQYDGIVVYNPMLEIAALCPELHWKQKWEFPEGSGVYCHGLKFHSPEQVLSSPGFGTVLEATKRLVAVAGKQVGVIAGINGPLSTLTRLIEKPSPESQVEFTSAVQLVGELLLAEVRALVEQRVDMVLIIEDFTGDFTPELLKVLGKVITPIGNVVKYFDSFLGLLLRVPSLQGQLVPLELFKMGQGITFLGDSAFQPAIEGLRRAQGAVGIALDTVNFRDKEAIISSDLQSRLRRQLGPGQVVFTTLGELEGETPVENIKLISMFCKEAN